MSSKRLEGKTAIVTGSGQGIGAGIARVFAREGAQVVIVTRTEAHGNATLADVIAEEGQAALCVADVGDPQQISRSVAFAIGEYGKLDIVVHNAASFVGGMVEDLVDSDLEESLNVNLKAAFRLSKEAIPHLRAQGGGRLLFTLSVTGPRVAMPGASYCAASKSGLNGFIRTAAIELAKDNITVNGVEPGFIKTPAMNLLADSDGQEVMARYVPMRAFGTPEDIAYAMLYLASEEARYVTGQTIVVDGGSTLPESPVFADQDTAGVKGLAKNNAGHKSL